MYLICNFYKNLLFLDYAIFRISKEAILKEKQAFTIMELVITTIILAVVCIVAPLTFLKKDVKPKAKRVYKNLAVCADTAGCYFDAATTTLYKSDGVTEISQKTDYNKSSGEFYTIQLIGGGGGGTADNVGIAGEIKTFYLPKITKNNDSDTTNLLTGIYFLKPGAGGAKNKNGAISQFCTAKANKTGGCKTEIVSAKGGVATIDADAYAESNGNGEQAVTGIDENITSAEDVGLAAGTALPKYGRGGNNNGSGISGLVIIK